MLKKILKKFILKQVIYNPIDLNSEDYILKYSLPFINKFMCINIISKEAENMHSHNRSFISIILKGGYIERILKRGNITGEVVVKKRTVGSIIYRHHSDFHQIIPFAKTYTLFIYFRKISDGITWLVNGKVFPEAKYWLKLGYSKEHMRELYKKQKPWNRLT